MPVLSKDFLNFATDSVQRADEIGYRNAVARSYYAMFHEVGALLASVPNFSSHAHDGLVQYLIHPDKDEPFDRMELKGLAYMLKQQKGKRALADYDLSSDVSESDALESIRTAERLFQKCQEMIGKQKKISG